MSDAQLDKFRRNARFVEEWPNSISFDAFGVLEIDFDLLCVLEVVGGAALDKNASTSNTVCRPDAVCAEINGFCEVPTNIGCINQNC